MRLRAILPPSAPALCALGWAALGCSGSISSPGPEPSAGGGRGSSAGAANAPRTTTSSVSDRGAPGGDALPSTPASDAGTTGGSTGVGGTGGITPTPSDESFCDAPTEVLKVSCGGGSCHSNPDATIGDFAVGAAEAESYVGVPSVRNAACGVIIDPADPSESLMLRKVTGDFPSPTCGGAMPVSGPELTNQQMDCLESWLRKFQSASD